MDSEHGASERRAAGLCETCGAVDAMRFLCDGSGGCIWLCEKCRQTDIQDHLDDLLAWESDFGKIGVENG